MTKTQNRKQQVAAILGVDPEKIAVSNPDYARLLREGVTITPHVSYWRGRTRLTWDHMGLWFEDGQEKNAVENVMNLGQLNLLPLAVIKALGTLETKIRMLPKKRGIETMFGAFIPVTSYPEYKQEADSLTAEFLALRDDLDQNWANSMIEVETNLRKAARWAWRQKQGDPKGLAEILTETRFVDRLVAAAKSLIPAREMVYRSFSLDFELRYVNLPDQIAAEVAQAEIEANRAKVERENTRVDLIASQERAEMLRQMNADMINQSRVNAQKLMDDFFLNLVAESRQLAHEVYADVIKGIRKNGKVHGRSIVSLRNLITQVTKLATFYNGDRDLETILAPAREILAALPEHRLAKTDDYLAQMAEVRNLAKDQLDGLGVSVRAGKGLEITHKAIDVTPRGKRTVTDEFQLDGIEIKKRGKRALTPVTG